MKYYLKPTIFLILLTVLFMATLAQGSSDSESRLTTEQLAVYDEGHSENHVPTLYGDNSHYRTADNYVNMLAPDLHRSLFDPLDILPMGYFCKAEALNACLDNAIQAYSLCDLSGGVNCLHTLEQQQDACRQTFLSEKSQWKP